MEKKIHNITALKDTRRILRNNMTPEELLLWSHLKSNQLDNKKFRRQHSIDGYVLDFYCATERLAIELDGADHFTEDGKLYDTDRTQHLGTYNIRVVRFENSKVINDISSVLEEIRKHLMS